MTEPTLTPEQSRLLCNLFARVIKTECSCDFAKASWCNRCDTVNEIQQSFPGTFVQACIDAARWPK